MAECQVDPGFPSQCHARGCWVQQIPRPRCWSQSRGRDLDQVLDWDQVRDPGQNQVRGQDQDQGQVRGQGWVQMGVGYFVARSQEADRWWEGDEEKSWKVLCHGQEGYPPHLSELELVNSADMWIRVSDLVGLRGSLLHLWFAPHCHEQTDFRAVNLSRTKLVQQCSYQPCLRATSLCTEVTLPSPLTTSSLGVVVICTAPSPSGGIRWSGNTAGGVVGLCFPGVPFHV